MTPFDYAFIAVFLILAIAGFTRGVILEVSGLFAWVASIWASIRLGPDFEPFVHPLTDQPTARWLLASAAVGLIVYVLIVTVARFVSRALKETFVGPVDRMLGLLFGAAKALIIVGALTFVGLQFGIARQEWWKRSHLAPAALQASMVLDRFVDFEVLLKGGRDFQMPKAVQEAEEQARQLIRGIDSLNEAAQLPKREE